MLLELLSMEIAPIGNTHLVQFRTHCDLRGSHIGGHIVCFCNVEAGER
jgi:hypothetical protein